jgi:hypothetical protein
MTLLYGRSILLDVFAGNQKLNLSQPGNQTYDISFDIQLDETEKPNRAKIMVHNLEEDGMIFRGVTTNIINQPQRLGWVTEIYSGEGEKEFSNNVFVKSYTAGTQILVILKDIIAAIGLPFELDFSDPFVTLPRGKSYANRVKDVLSKVTKAHGLEWSVQLGVLEIKPVGAPVKSQVRAELLSSETGMLDSPALIERQDETENTKKKDKKDQRIIGVKVRSLLNHRIRPNRLIEIRPQQTVFNLGKLSEARVPKKTAEGVWRVDRAHFMGDNQLGPFDVEAEAYVGVQEL